MKYAVQHFQIKLQRLSTYKKYCFFFFFGAVSNHTNDVVMIIPDHTQVEEFRDFFSPKKSDLQES